MTDEEELLSDIEHFYNLLSKELRNRASCAPHELNGAEASEANLFSLRRDWKRDVYLVNRLTDLQFRLQQSQRSPGLCEIFTRVHSLWGSDQDTGFKQSFRDAKSTPCSTVDRYATVSSWLCEMEQQLNRKVLPRLQKFLFHSASFKNIEDAASKMSRISGEYSVLLRSGLINSQQFERIQKTLQISWMFIRELIDKESLVVPKKASLCGRRVRLLEEYLHQTARFEFDNHSIEETKTRLCNEYLFRSLTPKNTKQKLFTEKKKSYHPQFLTPEKQKFVPDCLRPPVAVTIYSLPDISTTEFQILGNLSKPSTHIAHNISSQLRTCISMPQLRTRLGGDESITQPDDSGLQMGSEVRSVTENSFSEMTDDSDAEEFFIGGGLVLPRPSLKRHFFNQLLDDSNSGSFISLQTDTASCGVCRSLTSSRSTSMSYLIDKPAKNIFETTSDNNYENGRETSTDDDKFCDDKDDSELLAQPQHEKETVNASHDDKIDGNSNLGKRITSLIPLDHCFEERIPSAESSRSNVPILHNENESEAVGAIDLSNQQQDDVLAETPWKLEKEIEFNFRAAVNLDEDKRDNRNWDPYVKRAPHQDPLIKNESVDQPISNLGVFPLIQHCNRVRIPPIQVSTIFILCVMDTFFCRIFM